MDARLKNFTPEEHQTWRRLFKKQTPKRREQLVDLFSEGLEILGISGDHIPDLEAVNRKLMARTGFRGVPVPGLEAPIEFFDLLARKEFPVGNFIRNAGDLNYTPAPDVFHDLYGHLPFFVDPAYARFCEEFGKTALRYRGDEDAIRQFDRLFWFSVEFALTETKKGRRIFGAGIASSYGECAFALGPEPEVLPFDLERIRLQDFRIDEFQKRLFLLDQPEQLYGCLPEFERLLKAS